jgi:hypothetical protein
MPTDHLSTEQLEEYAMGCVREPELTRVEEHLLWCLEWVDRAEAVDRFILLLQAGAIKGGFEIEPLAEEYRPKK